MAKVSFRASKVASGFEALVVVGKQRFDVLITDVAMPNMNGVEMLRHVVELFAIGPASCWRHEMVIGEPRSLVATSSSTTTFELANIGWHARCDTSTKVWTEQAPNGDWNFHYEASVRAFLGPPGGAETPFADNAVSGVIKRSWV